MRDENTSAYDRTTQNLPRESSGVGVGDLPLLFAAIAIGVVVGLFNGLRRQHQPEQPEADVKAKTPAAPPAEYLHPHGC